MAYATLDDIRGEMPNFALTANSKPNEARAQEFLNELHAEIDAVLRAMGYVVPVSPSTSPLSFAIVKAMIQQGAIARILRARNYGVDAPEAIGARDAQQNYRDMIKRLTDPRDPFSLPDAEGRLIVDKFSQDIAESHIRGLDLDPDAEPAFTQGQVF